MSATDLLQFAGVVIPLSFIGLRLYLDGGDITKAADDQTDAERVAISAIAMLGLLVGSVWMAIFELVLPDIGFPFMTLGYLFAGLGITVPLWILWQVKEEFGVDVF